MFKNFRAWRMNYLLMIANDCIDHDLKNKLLDKAKYHKMKLHGK
ncbi:hypothetical protein [Sutcliffiella halmapala]|nr:hypothetical protein [Sutcliffiella halmapala]